MNKYSKPLPNLYSRKLTAFRTRNHRLPIKTGRWNGTPINDRKCFLCDKNELGDEFHYICKCSHFQESRKLLIKKQYYTHPNVIKFKTLLNNENKEELINLSKFITIIMKETR